MRRLLCHPTSLRSTFLPIPARNRNQITGSTWPLSGVYWPVSAYRLDSVHLAHYGTFNRWSEQVSPAQRWFTVAKRGFNDYRGRQLLTLWCVLDNVIGSGSPPGTCAFTVYAHALTHRPRINTRNTITPSESFTTRDCTLLCSPHHMGGTRTARDFHVQPRPTLLWNIYNEYIICR